MSNEPWRGASHSAPPAHSFEQPRRLPTCSCDLPISGFGDVAGYAPVTLHLPRTAMLRPHLIVQSRRLLEAARRDGYRVDGSKPDELIEWSEAVIRTNYQVANDEMRQLLRGPRWAQAMLSYAREIQPR